MLKLICAAPADNTGSIIMMVGLLLLLIVYMFFNSKNRKKQQEEAVKRLNELKVGDKIVTHSGIYGEIVSMRETTAGKIFVIKTGADEDAKKASYLTISAYVIAGIDEKQDVVLDAEGNVIEPEDQQKLKEEVLKEKAEKEPEENEEKKEEKPKKKTTKKSTKKAEPAAPKAEPATADKAN